MNNAVINEHKDLVSRCLVGDRKSYYKLYQLYSRNMYNVVYRIVLDEDEADDILQESFISVFEHLHTYRGDSTLGSWIKRIVVNKAITHLKNRKWERVDLDENLDELNCVSDEDSFNEFPLTVEKVKSGIVSLPEGYRTVLSLYLLEGYDHAEIAEILKITESTSKSQLNRAKRKLKEWLEKV